MINKFTAKAQRALERAHSEARSLGHTYIGSEHLLLGLVGESDSIASKLLISKGVDFDILRRIVIEVSGQGIESHVSASDMTPKTKHIIEQSAFESNKYSSSYIGTEHLLFALLGEKESVAMKLLEQSGVSASDLRADILAYFTATSQDKSKGAAKSKDASKKIAGAPTLSNYGRDLTALAKEGKIDPVIGRERETQRVIHILSRRTKNNPCLVGEPGVGKTAVVEGLAQLIADSNVPKSLVGKRIVTLDVPSMIAGAKYRGEFEDRMKTVMDEVAKAEDIILFVDEMHVMVGAGAAEGAVDAANILKPALARGEIRMIGATTLSEYRSHIEKDSALERRFQSVNVSEPDAESAIRILRGLRDKYEAHHSLSISDEAIEAAVRLSVRYIPDRYLPDKAIDLIDEAASRLHIGGLDGSPELLELEKRLVDLEREKDEAIADQNFELAAELRDEEIEVRRRKDELSFIDTHESEQGKTVRKEDIAEVITAWTGIPAGRLAKEESERLMGLETALGKRVIGQEEAISAISSAVRRGRLGLKDEKSPIGSFIFLGRTGVGKTELAKALAEELFGSESAMIRLDMSEYMERHSASKLIGSPPGYVGYDEGGQLTERVRRRPYSVVLFDEIEKAHPDVYDMLLQLLDDGVLTDSQGFKVDFRNTVVIMTSNLGAGNTDGMRTLGFSAADDGVGENERQRERMMDALRAEFKPEFINRIDEIIVFNPLSVSDIAKIAERMLDGLASRADGLGVRLEFDESVPLGIAEKCYDKNYGARVVRRTVIKDIENELAEKILRGEFRRGERVKVLWREGRAQFLGEGALN